MPSASKWEQQERETEMYRKLGQQVREEIAEVK
jgi:hypothetical protein